MNWPVSGEKLTYYTSSDEKAKHLLALCRESHQFSMALAPRLGDIRRKEDEGEHATRYFPLLFWRTTKNIFSILCRRKLSNYRRGQKWFRYNSILFHFCTAGRSKAYNATTVNLKFAKASPWSRRCLAVSSCSPYFLHVVSSLKIPILCMCLRYNINYTTVLHVVCDTRPKCRNKLTLLSKEVFVPNRLIEANMHTTIKVVKSTIAMVVDSKGVRCSTVSC